MTEFYELGVPIADTEGLTSLTASLIEACKKSPYVEFIELRAIFTQSKRVDVIVIDAGDSTIRRNNPGKIKRTERFAITVDQQSRIPVVFRALRKDFPAMAHMYYADPGEPKALCLYNVSWSTVERQWTPERFIQRMFWWLKESSELKLHREDQPLEPLFFHSNYELILPANINDVFEKNGLTLSIELISNEHDRQSILKASVVKKVVRSELGAAKFQCVELSSNPIECDTMSSFPGTLGELSDKLGNDGFEEKLFEAIYNLIPEKGVPAKHQSDERLLFLNYIPRMRNGKLQRHDVIGYVLDKSLFELAQALDVIFFLNHESRWYRTQPVNNDLAGLADSQKNWKSFRLFPVEVRTCLDSDTARNVSGIETNSASFYGILAGVGALGGQLAQIWTRGAWGNWCFVDPDNLNPHNLARHVGYDHMLGWPKVSVLLGLTSGIYPSHKAHSALQCSITEINQELSQELKNASILVDVTASYSVPRELSLREDVPRVVSLFLTPSGNCSVLLMEDSNRRLRAAEIEAQYYRAILNSEWGENHLTNHQGDLWVGGGCRDISVRLADDRMHLHAGILAKQLRRRVGSHDAQASIWCVDEATDTVTNYEIELYSTSKVKRGDWTIVYDEGLINKIRAARVDALPSETGGVLLGITDTKTHTLTLVDSLPAPNDSTSSQTHFIRGKEGLPDTLSTIHKRTAGIVDYIGDWHSHPDGYGARPSNDDNQLIKQLAETMSQDGLPALMLIVSATEISFTVM